jgi:hypothetical protein
VPNTKDATIEQLTPAAVSARTGGGGSGSGSGSSSSSSSSSSDSEERWFFPVREAREARVVLFVLLCIRALGE